MDTNNYHLELYKAKVKRLRRLSLLFFTLLGFAIVNFYTHQYDYKQYYKNLNDILYDFTQDYEEVLINWAYFNYESDANKEYGYIHKVSNDNFVIEFQNEPVSSAHITWSEIPHLASYLEKHIPKIRHYNTLFSWELPTPIFLFVAILIPLIFLILIVMNIKGLAKIKWIIGSKTKIEGNLKLLLRSVFYSRIALRNKEFPILQAIFVGIIFFLTASLTSMLFISVPRFAARHITGTLYIGSDIVPSFFIGDISFELQPDIFRFLGLVVAICAVLSVIIGRDYWRLMKS